MFSLSTLRRTYFRTARLFSDAASGSGDAGKHVTLNFCSPTNTIFMNKQVASVILPGELGEYEILPNHSAVIAALSAGLVKIKQLGSSEYIKYFVSGGLALTHPDSTTDITVGEVCKVDDLNGDFVRSEMTKYSDLLKGSGLDEAAKARHQISYNTCKAMATSLGISAA